LKQTSFARDPEVIGCDAAGHADDMVAKFVVSRLHLEKRRRGMVIDIQSIVTTKCSGTSHSPLPVPTPD
jgi:hypothetical protein